MGENGKFTPKTPSKPSRNRCQPFLWSEHVVQIEPVIRAVASAGGSSRATGVSGTSNVPGTSGTSGTGNPNSASVCQQSSTGQQPPLIIDLTQDEALNRVGTENVPGTSGTSGTGNPNSASVCQQSSTGLILSRRQSQNKDGKHAPKQRLVNCDGYLQQALNRVGTKITRVSNASTAGRSAGSAGPSTPQVQPSSSIHKRENGPFEGSAIPGTSGTSGAGLPSRASAVGSQWLNGQKSPPSDQSLQGLQTNGRRFPTRELNSFAVSSALPVVPLLGGTSGTSGTGVPNNASAVVPQSSKTQKRPTSKKSIQRKKNDGKKTPTQRRKASAKRGRGVSKSKNSYYSQAVWMTMSRMLASGYSPETVLNFFKNGPLGTSIIPPIPATSSAGMPSAVRPQGLNGQKSPPRDQSIQVQKKVKGKTPTGKRNSSVHQSMPSTISEHIPTNVFQENSGRQASTGSAGPSTPQVQPITSTKPIPNGHLRLDMRGIQRKNNAGRKTSTQRPKVSAKRGRGVSKSKKRNAQDSLRLMSRMLASGYSTETVLNFFKNGPLGTSVFQENSGRQASTGSAGPSTPQVQPITSTKPIPNGHLRLDIPPAIAGPSGACMPSRPRGPQLLNCQISPQSNQSFQVQKKDKEKNPTGGHNSSVNRSMPRPTNVFQENSGRQASSGSAGPSTPQVQPITSTKPIPNGHLRLDVVPGTSGTSGTGVPSSESAVGPQSSNSLSNPASIQGLQGQNVGRGRGRGRDRGRGRGRFPTQEPISSAISSALPINSSKSTGEYRHIVTNGSQLEGMQRLSSKLNGGSKIESSTSKSTSSNGVVEIVEVESVKEQKKKKTVTNKNNATTIEQIDVEEVNDDNNDLYKVLNSMIETSGIINSVGQNIFNAYDLIKNGYFFKMLQCIAIVILKLPNNMLKELLRNNVDLFEKVDSLTNRFESVFNKNINANESSKLNNTEEVPRGSGSTPNNSGVIDLDDEMEAVKEPEDRTSRQHQISCGENGVRCKYCVAYTQNIDNKRLDILISRIHFIAHILNNKIPGSKDQRRP